MATCRTEDGGNPRCKLGFLTRKDSSERLNRTIEIKGRTAAEIKAGGRSQVKKFEDFGVAIPYGIIRKGALEL